MSLHLHTRTLFIVIRVIRSYVDAELWEKTRDLFPEEVTKRLQGESVDIPDRELDFSYVQSRQHYGDGELRKEYEMEVNTARHDGSC